MSLNLLPNQAKFQMDKIKMAALSKKVMVSVLTVWLVVAVIVVGSELATNWWIGKGNDKYNAMMTDYLRSSTEVVTSQTIKFRAKLLGKVLAERFEYASAFDLVNNIFDQKIIIRNLELKEKSFFVMTVAVLDVKTMEALESRVAEINSGLEPKVKKIIIKSASYSKADSLWLVSMEVYVK